jgi:hypothetical protein
MTTKIATPITLLSDALRKLLDAHALPDDLRRVPDSIIEAHDNANTILRMYGRPE